MDWITIAGAFGLLLAALMLFPAVRTALWLTRSCVCLGALWLLTVAMLGVWWAFQKIAGRL